LRGVWQALVNRTTAYIKSCGGPHIVSILMIDTTCYNYDFVACISPTAINTLHNCQLVTYMLVPTAVGGWPVVYLHIKVKVKERIVLREIHLRTTGRHLSMASHSCHPTEVTAPPSPRPGRLVLNFQPRKDERLSWPTHTHE